MIAVDGDTRRTDEFSVDGKVDHLNTKYHDSVANITLSNQVTPEAINGSRRVMRMN